MPKNSTLFYQRLQGDISWCVWCMLIHAASLVKFDCANRRNRGFFLFVSLSFSLFCLCASTFLTKQHYPFWQLTVCSDITNRAKKSSCKVFLCVFSKPATGSLSNGMFLEARFSAVTFQWSKRLPWTSHSVQSYLAHTEHKGKARPVSGEQQLITQRYWCPCQ